MAAVVEDVSLAKLPSPELPVKYLRLSRAMHPNTIIFKIQLARRDHSIDCLSCRGLNLREEEYENDSGSEKTKKQPSDTIASKEDNDSQQKQQEQKQPSSITQHLKELIHSRTWQRIEFESCMGAERLLVECKDYATKTTMPSIDFLSIRFSPPNNTGSNNNHQLFGRLWKCWNIQKCRLSLEFTNERIQDFVDRNSVSALTELDLTGSTWRRDDDEDTDDDEGVENQIDENGTTQWKKFCRALVYNHPLLTKLNLRHSQLSDSKMACFIDTTVRRHPTLEETTIPGNTCQREALMALSRALSDENHPTLSTQPSTPLSSRLKALTITNDRLSEEVVPGLQEFCACLHHTQSLKYLSLGDYMLHESDMIALVSSLSKISCIRELSLLSCGMTAQSIRRLCREGLQSNSIPSLRALSVPEDAKDEMLIALEDNTSLERLVMEGQLINKHKYYLDLNRGGRKLLRQSVVPMSLWPLVLARAMNRKSRKVYHGGEKRHLDVLYCLLRNKVLLEIE